MLTILSWVFTTSLLFGRCGVAGVGADHEVQKLFGLPTSIVGTFDTFDNAADKYCYVAQRFCPSWMVARDVLKVNCSNDCFAMKKMPIVEILQSW